MSSFSRILIYTAIIAFVVFAFLAGSHIIQTPSVDYSATGSLATIFIIGLSALLDSVNPCAFSILFLTVAFLFSTGKSRKDILKIGGLYILGIFLTYVLIGVGILQVLNFFNIPNGLAKLGAVILIVFALINLINEFFPQFPIKLKIPQSAHNLIANKIEKATKVSALLLGFLVGMFEFPCTGGPYLFVLGLLHDNNTSISGLGYLIYYNIIFILPLVLALIFSVDEKVASVLDRARKQDTRRSRVALSAIMIVLGLLIMAL
jgi:cytochrome c-type biogenesis protein